MGEEQLEAAGAGRASRLRTPAHTLLSQAGEPRGPGQGPRPTVSPTPGIRPSTGPEVLDRLGAGGRESLGVLSCPEATLCCSALCCGLLTYVGRRVRLAFAFPHSQ